MSAQLSLKDTIAAVRSMNDLLAKRRVASDTVPRKDYEEKCEEVRVLREAIRRVNEVADLLERHEFYPDAPVTSAQMRTTAAMIKIAVDLPTVCTESQPPLSRGWEEV